MTQDNRLTEIAGRFDSSHFAHVNEECSLSDYIDMCHERPRLVRTAFQRLYDMIVSAGSSEYERYRETLTHYNFFDNEEVPIFGLRKSLDELVKFIKGAAGGYGTEKRILLLHGPVGSAKSTICRLIKRGLERYSDTPEGAWYSFKWINLDRVDGLFSKSEDPSAMNEEPLKLFPQDLRNTIIHDLNNILQDSVPEDEKNSIYSLKVNGELNPRCKFFMTALLKHYNGNLSEVLNNHIVVCRRVYSEADRVGIATFQPKDEKNQDATELTGDMNYTLISEYGSDSDPRAFNFDGEFCVGNRGFVEFIEILKLQQEFLYDLLGATQEQSIKPKKFAQVSIDEVLFGHTNNPEFEKLKANPYMEALRDRTVKIDIPYLLSVTDEVNVLKQDYAQGKVRQHVAPHTLEMAGLWAVLTRLQDDKDGDLTLVDKAKLYDGEFLPGWNEDRVKEMMDKYPGEGMSEGVSARYVQDKLSNCLSSHHDYINPFMVLNELREGLSHSSLITDAEHKARYETCVEMTIKEYSEVVKNEIQKALVADENALIRLCTNYIDNILAYTNDRKIRDKFTQQDREPNERMMRSIETKIGVPENKTDDFRREIAINMGDLANKGEKFDWKSNPKLKKALQLKLFEETRDQVKLSALSDGINVVDEDTQQKIDALKTRLIKFHGYNDQSARDVLEYAGSIFARGDVEDE